MSSGQGVENLLPLIKDRCKNRKISVVGIAKIRAGIDKAVTGVDVVAEKIFEDFCLEPDSANVAWASVRHRYRTVQIIDGGAGKIMTRVYDP
jgi:hypothetical protein